MIADVHAGNVFQPWPHSQLRHSETSPRQPAKILDFLELFARPFPHWQGEIGRSGQGVVGEGVGYDEGRLMGQPGVEEVAPQGPRPVGPRPSHRQSAQQSIGLPGRGPDSQRPEPQPDQCVQGFPSNSKLWKLTAPDPRLTPPPSPVISTSRRQLATTSWSAAPPWWSL